MYYANSFFYKWTMLSQSGYIILKSITHPQSSEHYTVEVVACVYVPNREPFFAPSFISWISSFSFLHNCKDLVIKAEIKEINLSKRRYVNFQAIKCSIEYQRHTLTSLYLKIVLPVGGNPSWWLYGCYDDAGVLTVWHWMKLSHNLFNQRLKNLLPFRIAREWIVARRWLETAGKVFIPWEKQYTAIDSLREYAFTWVDDSASSRDVALKKTLQEPGCWAPSRYPCVSTRNNYFLPTKGDPSPR